MNYLVGYGATEQQPAGILDKIKSWWSGMSTTEKVLYGVAGGVTLLAGAALVTGGSKKSYAANKSRKSRKARKNGKRDKRTTAGARLRKLRAQTDEAIDQAFQLMRRAHGMGAHAPAIQHSLNELALAKQANFRGDDLTARGLIESALNRVGIAMELPQLQSRHESRYVTVDALSASGKPIKRQRMAVLAMDVGEYTDPSVKAAMMEAGRLRGERESLDRAIHASLEQGRAEWGSLDAGIERALASGHEDAARELLTLRDAKAKAREEHITRLIEEHHEAGARMRGLGAMVPNAAALSRAQRMEMLKTPEGREELARLRQAASMEAAEAESSLSVAERKRAEERFAGMAGKAVDVATSLAAQRELEKAAQRRAETEAVLEGRYKRLTGGTVVGTGDKQRRAPAVAGERGSHKTRVKGGGFKAVAEAARLVATADEFPGVQGRGAELGSFFGARRTTKYPTVRAVRGEPSAVMATGLKTVKEFQEYGIIKQAKGESLSDFKARALNEGYIPMPAELDDEGKPVKGADGKVKPRVAVREAGWRYRVVPIAPGEVGGPKMKRVRLESVSPRVFAMKGGTGYFPGMENFMPRKLRKFEPGTRVAWVDLPTGERGALPASAIRGSGAAPIIRYEPVDPEEVYSKKDQERLGRDIGYREGAEMDPHGGRALAIMQTRYDRKLDPYGWGYQRGVTKAISERRWLSKAAERRIGFEGEKHQRFPMGYTMTPGEYEGELGAARYRGTPDAGALKTYSKNRRRRAKRSRRAA